LTQLAIKRPFNLLPHPTYILHWAKTEPSKYAFMR